MARRTREEWQQLIKAQQSSGLIAAEFCRQHSINAKYFSLRKKQLQLTQRSQGQFIQVKASEAVKAATNHQEPNSIKIRRIDVEVRLADAEDTAKLSAVLSQLLR